jgi:hypothetical protein
MALIGMPPVDDDGEAAMGRASSASPKTAYRARKDGDWETITAEIDETRSEEELKQWAKANKQRIETLPQNWREQLLEAYDRKMKSFSS